APHRGLWGSKVYIMPAIGHRATHGHRRVPNGGLGGLGPPNFGRFATDSYALWFANEYRRSAIAGQPFAFKQKGKVVEVRWMQIISCRRFRSLWLYENRDQLRGRSPAAVHQFALQALQYPSEVQRPESGRYTGTAFPRHQRPSRRWSWHSRRPSSTDLGKFSRPVAQPSQVPPFPARKLGVTIRARSLRKLPSVRETFSSRTSIGFVLSKETLSS